MTFIATISKQDSLSHSIRKRFSKSGMRGTFSELGISVEVNILSIPASVFDPRNKYVVGLDEG